jgi:hypothetical protein
MAFFDLQNVEDLNPSPMNGSFIAGKCWKHLSRMKNFNGT